jgi:uncharacterized protein YrzB (UPF0473 family)
MIKVYNQDILLFWDSHYLNQNYNSTIDDRGEEKMTAIKDDEKFSGDKRYYQQMLKTHLDAWETEYTQLNKIAIKAKGKSKLEITSHIDEINEKILEGKRKLREIDEADENLWEIIKEGIEAYWELLKISIEEIMYKYKH